jgi:hypothetical protein
MQDFKPEASMATTRRSFLQAGALTAGAAAQAQTPAAPAGKIRVPQMKFFHAEIGRLVLGVNPLYGWSHYNNNFSQAMREYYTPERVTAVLHQAESYGINSYNYVHQDRAPEDWARYRAEGGKMHLIAQVTAKTDTDALARDLKPLAMQRQGEVVDDAWQAGKMETVKEWCKKVRDLGILVGVGSHLPEVLAYVEEKGWDVDFYAGCVYNRRRMPEEIRTVLGGQMVEMPRELYLKSDPARMYKVFRQTKKPCFAFKVLAAGRLAGADIEQAFQTAYESIKPNDGVYVGVFPKYKDELRENAMLVQKILARG